MITVIPMAGLGSRFSKEGYLLPKPLIPVSGKPMITQVLDGLPLTSQTICLVRPEHIEEYALDQVIQNSIENALIIPDSATKGQAVACMLGLENVADDEEVFITACDNSFLFNDEKFATLRTDPTIDCIVWTFTKDPLLTAKPEAWGWIKLAEDGEEIADMSVKVPVSDDPFNDHAVVATFWFRRASDFKAAYAKMVEEDHRVNNEFYVDSMPIFMKKLGKKSVIFPVDLYVGWGKPADLYAYQREEFLYTIGRASSPLWQKYFDGRK